MLYTKSIFYKLLNNRSDYYRKSQMPSNINISSGWQKTL